VSRLILMVISVMRPPRTSVRTSSQAANLRTAPVRLPRARPC
jgi:hypothetical protein